jgi:hypothetical protein
MEQLGRLAASVHSNAALVADRKAVVARHAESVKQRLRWAVGANPDGVRELVDDFDRRMIQTLAVADSGLALARDLASTADVVCEDEAYRHLDVATSPGGVASSRPASVTARTAEFLALLQRCSEACGLVDKFDSERTSPDLRSYAGKASHISQLLARADRMMVDFDERGFVKPKKYARVRSYFHGPLALKSSKHICSTKYGDFS